MKKWDLEEFKIFIEKEIVKRYEVSASEITLKSFYIAEVFKPKEVTRIKSNFITINF